MNNLMLLGFIIVSLGIIVTVVWYFILYKKHSSLNLKTRLLLFSVLIIFTIIGLVIVQKGASNDILEFKENELKLLNSGKSFSEFTEKDKELYAFIDLRCMQRDDEEAHKYEAVLLNWKIDDYLEDNKDRNFTREEAKYYVLKRWKYDKEHR